MGLSYLLEAETLPLRSILPPRGSVCLTWFRLRPCPLVCGTRARATRAESAGLTAVGVHEVGVEVALSSAGPLHTLLVALLVDTGR